MGSKEQFKRRERGSQSRELRLNGVRFRIEYRPWRVDLYKVPLQGGTIVSEGINRDW